MPCKCLYHFFQSKIFWCTPSAKECSIGAFPLSLPYVRLGQFPAGRSSPVANIFFYTLIFFTHLWLVTGREEAINQLVEKPKEKIHFVVLFCTWYEKM